MSARARFRNAATQRGYTQLENVILFDCKLSPAARVLYGAIKHYAWKLDGDIPAQAELAKALGTGMSERTIREAFKELEEGGYLTVERRSGAKSTVWIEEPRALSTTPADIAGVGEAISAGEARQDLPGSTRAGQNGGQDNGEDARANARALQGSVDSQLRAEVYGRSDVSITSREARKVAIAATEIRKAGGTAEEVTRRARAYRQHATYKDCALTAPALAQHWGELDAGPSVRLLPCPECHIGGGHHAADCTLAKREDPEAA